MLPFLAGIGGAFLASAVFLLLLSVKRPAPAWTRRIEHPAIVGLGYAGLLTLTLTGVALFLWLLAVAVHLLRMLF